MLWLKYAESSRLILERKHYISTITSFVKALPNYWHNVSLKLKQNAEKKRKKDKGTTIQTQEIVKRKKSNFWVDVCSKGPTGLQSRSNLLLSVLRVLQEKQSR